MEKAGDEFVKSLAEKLPEFFKSFSEWWMMDRIINHKNENLENNDLLCWYLMQNIAKKKIETFANLLPEETKKQFDNEFSEAKKKMDEFEQKVKDLNNGISHAL
jgi:hypothetical protein